MATLSKALVKQAANRKPYIAKYRARNPDPANSTEPVDVFCRDMASTGYSYVDLADSMSTADGKPNAWRQKHWGELTAVHSICDEQGELIFTEDDIKDPSWARLYDGFRTDIVAIARQHNGVLAGDIVAEAKNSGDAALGAGA